MRDGPADTATASGDTEMTEEKHAFVKASGGLCLHVPTQGDKLFPISAETAEAGGYQVYEWPTVNGQPVEMADLRSYIPGGGGVTIRAAPDARPASAELTADGIPLALAAKLEAMIESANRDNARRQALSNAAAARGLPDEIVEMISDDMPIATAVGFIRGLPATSTNTQLQIEKENTQMQPGQTKADRLVEIKLGFLAERVNNNEPGAKALAAKVRSAALTAQARGEPLHVTLASLGIVL